MSVIVNKRKIRETVKQWVVRDRKSVRQKNQRDFGQLIGKNRSMTGNSFGFVWIKDINTVSCR